MKVTIAPGDIIEVELKNRKKYFQFIYKDDEYMAGHLIRAFEYEVKPNEKPDMVKILKSPIAFYTYTRVVEGVKDGLWKKVANNPIEQNFEPPTFRQTNDVFSITPKSSKWFIWKKNFANKKMIGELTDEYKKLPISSIYPPVAIVKWLDTGTNGFKTPD
jgi:hypothetical protein